MHALLTAHEVRAYGYSVIIALNKYTNPHFTNDNENTKTGTRPILEAFKDIKTFVTNV